MHIPVYQRRQLDRNIQSLYQRNTTDSDRNSLATEHEIVTHAKQYVDTNYPQPLSLALIAEKVGVTPGYLSSLFHRDAGESYIKYLTRIRMEQAAMLLRRQPAEKVYDVAERIGYVSVKHFSYVFKQHYGVPPGEYQAHPLQQT